MGNVIRVLGSVVKLAIGPVSALLHKIPQGQATGVGVSTLLAGIAIHFAVTRGWVPAAIGDGLAVKLATVFDAVGVFVTAWGDGRSRGATAK